MTEKTALPNYEVHNQEELDNILSFGEEELRFSTIELSIDDHLWKPQYKIEKVPFDHMRFTRSSHLNLPAPTVELGNIFCREYVDFIELRLIGGELTLSDFNRIINCLLTKTAINKCTLHTCHVMDTRIDVIEREEEYKNLGGKYMPFASSCFLENCILEKANIYFDFGGNNLLNNSQVKGIKYLDTTQPSDCKFLIGNNLMRI